MPRRRVPEVVRQRMWAALIKAANNHHDYPTKGIQMLIAKDAGVTKTAVSDWKKPFGNYPEDKTLRRLADTYGVSAEILSGWKEGDVLSEDFGPPDKALARSVDLAEQIAKRMIENPGLDDLLRVQRRVNELMLEGRSDQEIKGFLFDELDGGEPDET